MNKRRLADDPIFLSNCRWVISYICIWTTNKIWPLCACRSIDVAIILLLQLLRTATAAQTVQGCCRCRCLYSTVSVQYLYSYFNVLFVCSRVQLFQCVARVHLIHLFKCDIHVLSCTVVSMCYPRTLVYSYFNVLHVYTRYIYVNVLNTYSRVQLFQCATRVISCAVIPMCYTRTLVVISMCYTHTLGTFISMCYTRSLVYSYFNVLHAYSRVQLFQCVTRVLSCTITSMCYTRTLVYSYFNVLHAYSRVQLFQCVTRVLSCTVISMCYTRTLVCSYFNVLHAYSRVQLLQCVTRVLSCAVISMCYTRTLVVTSMCYTRTFGTVISMCFSSGYTPNTPNLG